MNRYDNPILQIKNVTRRVPNVPKPILDRVSMEVAAGERVGLVGPAGSGKSTLLRSIALLDPIESDDRGGGEAKILFRGRPVGDIPAYRRQVVFLHQRPAMTSGNVRQNLQLPFEFSAAVGRYSEDLAMEYFRSLGKRSSLLDQPVETLSGGEQQMVALIRAIQIDPIVLLLDEPCASLDNDSVVRFEELVNQWLATSTQRAIVLVTHDDAQVSRMTTRVVRLSGGAMVSD